MPIASQSPLRSPRRLARLAIAVAAVAASAALAGCGGDVSVTSPLGGELSTGGLPGGSATSTGAIAGRWTRTLLIEDAYGGYLSSESTWDFASDGVATFVNVVRDYAYGTSDVTVTSARWSVDGTTMTIRYVTPDAGTARFRWRIERFADGDVLWLGETRFVRVMR